jgi:hypothetical protein
VEKARENQMNVDCNIFNAMLDDEIDTLSIDELYDVQSEIVEIEKSADDAKRKLRNAILRRCETSGREALRAAGKDTGAKTLHANEHLDFKFEIPKKVEWDQPAMLAIVEDLASRGINVKEIVKITLAIEERKFNSLPQNIQALFLPARTVKDGEPKAVLVESKKER